ncbi:DUF7333 family protein [Haladaptatus sp. DFWS20]
MRRLAECRHSRQTILLMVLSSMAIFAAVAFWPGMKYGGNRLLQ